MLWFPFLNSFFLGALPFAQHMLCRVYISHFWIVSSSILAVQDVSVVPAPSSAVINESQQAVLNLPSTRLLPFVVHQLTLQVPSVLACFRLWSAIRVDLVSTDCIQLHAIMELMTYLESCISCFSEHSGYLALHASACGCSWWSAALTRNTADLMRSCRLVLEMLILTLLRDADFMTTSITTCLMRMSGPSAPCVVSSNQYQVAPSPRGSDVWALRMLGLASTLSIHGSIARTLCTHRPISRRPRAW